MFERYQHSQNPNSKPGTPGMIPSKSHIINWLKQLFPDLPLNQKIEDYGNGVIYCRIINHYYPGAIPSAKILMNPKNQYEYLNNLKHVQQAFVQHNIKINFDVNKVSKRKFLQNWALINAIYKNLTAEEVPQDNMIRQSGKRSHEMAFPESQFGSASKAQSIMQQPMNHNFNYMVPVWQRNSLNLCFNNSIAPNPIKVSPYMKENVQGGFNNNNNNGSPMKGKWSVNSHMFQNNQSAVVDRVKEILLKNSHDTEKIRQIKMLLNIPIEEEEVIKIEEDEEVVNHIVYNQNIKNHSSIKKVFEEVKEEKEEDLIEKVEKGQRNQSDTHPEKSLNKDKLLSAGKQRKPFKV